MPDAQSMIERVARATSLVWFGYDCLPSPMDSNYADGSKIGQCMRSARESIIAIREPIETMIAAHNSAEDCFDDMRRQAIADWQAMIDAALEEGRNGD